MANSKDEGEKAAVTGAQGEVATRETGLERATEGDIDLAVKATRELGQAVAGFDTASELGGAPDFVSELNAIDFGKMIGGPLQAAVDSQVRSAMATIDFIQKVGFTGEGDERKLVMVDFTHKRTGTGDDGNPTEESVAVTVPLLAVVPIPSIRIEHILIDFNVKLNSVETSKTDTKLGVNAELGIKYGPVNFKVSASYQRNTTTGIEIKKEYALRVQVKAVQDEMPAGLERVLGILAA
jgi:hypothetical protein